MISSLNHPHICTLFDVGHHDGVDFLVLEYLEGETVAERVARAGGLDPNAALKVAIDICDALDKAHRSGMVHRDLEPANVMLTKAGAKLLDFDLAKNAAPAIAPAVSSMLPTTPPDLTAQGTILGTFQYMAPDRSKGSRPTRTDIFAFGALLFEMLTGRTAVRRQNTRAPARRDSQGRAAGGVARPTPRPRGARPPRQHVPRERSRRPVSERARAKSRPQRALCSSRSRRQRTRRWRSEGWRNRDRHTGGGVS